MIKKDLLSRLKPKRVLVVGDLMLDVYKYGSVNRISPEAPVPVFSVEKTTQLPGGAGNVALNLAKLGCEVVLIGRIGYDGYGEDLVEILRHVHVDYGHLIREAAFTTTMKNRLIADGQHLLRLDEEELLPISRESEERAVEAASEVMEQVDIVTISDYAKGFCSHRLVQKIIKLAQEANVPTLVDPKGDQYGKYAGATLVKPNLKEAYAAAHCPKNTPLHEIAAAILGQTAVECLLVTRSEEGMSLFTTDEGQRDFPVHAKDVIDVCGAGDTVLAMLAFGLANQVEIDQTIALANVAASVTVEKVGCYSATLSDVAAKLLQSETNKPFYDSSDLPTLQFALSDEKVEVVCVDQEYEISNHLFEVIQTLCQEKEERVLIIYLDCDEISAALLHFFTSFDGIDYVILRQESFDAFLADFTPAKTTYLGNLLARLISL
ncbi:MAG: Bifunctional protein HldE [Chlamydiia bacterium]|nr:Bifunctional protein HldE [Chlamydiia bacterium]